MALPEGEELKVNYDDKEDEIVDKVNEVLRKLGVAFVYNEERSGDGYVIYDFVVLKEPGVASIMGEQGS